MTQKRFPLAIRIFFWMGIGIAFLLFVVTLFFLFLPEAYVCRQIEIQSKAMGWPVECQAFRYRPLGSFEFHGINISFQPDGASPPVPFLQIDRVQIQARIWPLLFRRISVSSIEIDTPRFLFTQAFSREIRSRPPQKPARKGTPFFKNFLLDTLALRNFTLRMEFPAGNIFQTLEWKGFNLHVSRFSFQTEWQGGISLFTNESTLKIDSKWGEKVWKSHLVLNLYSQKQGPWKMAFETSLSSSDGKKKLIGFDLYAHGAKGLGQGILDSTELFLGSQRALLASGQFSWIPSMMEFQVHSFPLALRSLRPMLSEFFSDSLFKSFQLEGEIALCSGKIFWRKNQLGLDFHSQWREVMVQGFSLFQIKGVEGRIDVLKDSVQDPMHVTGEAVFPLITWGPLSEIKNAKLAWALDFENGFSSHSGKISGTLESLWEGTGKIEASWKAKDFPQTKNLNGHAVMDISGMELATLSPSSKRISGKVHGHADLQITEGRKGKCEMSFFLPKLVFPSGEKQDSLPPLDFHASLHCVGKENFQKWVVENSKLWIGKGVSGRIHGEIFPQKREWHFRLDQVVFENPLLVSYLPSSWLEALEGIKAFGKETLELDLKASPKGMAIQGHFGIKNGGLELASGVRLQAVQGQMQFRGNEKQIAGNGKLVLENALFSQIRPDPFLKNQWEFAWAWRFPDGLEILQSRIILPDVAMESALHGKAEHLSTFPNISAKMTFRFASLDTIRITPSVSLLGGFETQMEMHTLKKDHLHIQGRAVFDSLHITLQPFWKIQNVFGKIPFSFYLDPIQRKWISPSVSRKYPVQTYSVQKTWFTAFYTTLSTLAIEKIKWKNYTLDHIQMDVDFSEGRFDVPQFRLEFLGGNAAGALSFRIQEGVPLWNIQADFGQINSATLVHGLKPGEETELNATMHFQGKGLNPKTDFDVDGALHITQMGSAFTTTLLEAMDPKGADRNIRLTRRLLSMGSKPKRFSFEIRHGHVYPSLELDQTWYSPLPIPEKIQYGRLPLAFFFQSPLLSKP